MDEQLAFYSIVLNWSFNRIVDDSDSEQINLNNADHVPLSIQPPLKKRKLNEEHASAPATPPPLEPTDALSKIEISNINKLSPKSPLVMKIPKKPNQTSDESKTIHPINLTEHKTNVDDSNEKKKPRFKRAVALKANNYKTRSQHQRTRNDTLYDELFPVEKFKKLTKFHRNQEKAEQLSKICTFPNTEAYKEHFASLLFDDLRARLESMASDQLKAGWSRDMLPAELIHDIGHDEYICCSFQILSSSDRWLYSVNTKMLVLIIYNIPDTNWKFKSFRDLPTTHLLAIVDEPPTQSHVKLQIHLSCDDERYQSFVDCFEDETDAMPPLNINKHNTRKRKRVSAESGKRKAMKIIFLENIQNRMREFRAICSAEQLRLKHIIMDPKSVLLQQQFCAQQPEYAIARDTDNHNKDTSSWVWSHVPDAYRKRLGRHLNSSQCKAIEKACQHKGVTLLQGPPGTGKTRTVLHIMNAFHIARTQAMFQSWLRTMFNRFHARLKRKKKKKKLINKKHDATDDGYTLQDVMRDVSQHSLSNKLREDEDVLDKPRILVAAPSNAAVDEIIIRLMEQQFVDGNDIKYRPPITRIGNMQKCRVEVGQQVSLQSKVDAFLNHRYDTGSNKNKLKYDERTKMKKLTDRIRFFAEKKREHEDKLAHYVKSRLSQFGTMDFESFQVNETGEIIHLLQEIHKYSKELQRCIWVKKLSRKAAQDKLIMSILLESEIIFTTLNSAGGRELRLLLNTMRSKQPDENKTNSAQLFDHCIIDEAGQCTEPDVLIPLIYDIDSVVLVGDPQQLPATVFSQGPSAWLYERSLFERLMSAQYPVHLLDTQYRMHPEISFFPNVHFYDDKLKNGDNVLSPRYIKSFHSDETGSNLFKPFLFFNIASNESRSGHSLYNLDEVGFIMQHLQLFYQTYLTPDVQQMSIGIITPYKQQQKKIIEALQRIPSLQKKNIEVATVDFYQGREKDIIFFSCVRAGGKKGIGFLSDIRRMNVAITRARYSLWIVGNQSSLKKNPDWSQLVKHAQDRKCMRCLQFDKQQKRYKVISVAALKNLQQSKQKNKNKNNRTGGARGGRGHKNRGRGRGNWNNNRRGGRGRGRGRGIFNNRMIPIPRPILVNDNNNNKQQQNVSMPVIIDYGDLSATANNNNNLNGHHHNSLNDTDFYGDSDNKMVINMPPPHSPPQINTMNAQQAQFQHPIAIPRAHLHHPHSRPHPAAAVLYQAAPARILHTMHPLHHVQPATIVHHHHPHPHHQNMYQAQTQPLLRPHTQYQHHNHHIAPAQAPPAQNQSNGGGAGGFTDYTKTHLNSSAFDD